MSEETPRNGVLAQCIEAFQKGTAKDASGLQKSLVAALIVVPLLLALTIAVALVWVVLKVNLAASWRWVVSAGAVCSGGILAARLCRKKRAPLPAGTEPGQQTVSAESGAESDDTASDDGNNVGDGSG